MAGLVASGPLSLLDIQGEFGGAAPISISEYYAAASGVPASGEISIHNFHGKSKYVPISPSYTSILYSVTIQPGTGGIGEDYWRTGASWTNGTGKDGTIRLWGDIGVGRATKGGYDTFTKIAGFELVSNGTRIKYYPPTFGEPAASFFTWDNTAYIGVGGSAYISAYAWGNFNADQIIGGKFNVGGTL